MLYKDWRKVNPQAPARYKDIGEGMVAVMLETVTNHIGESILQGTPVRITTFHRGKFGVCDTPAEICRAWRTNPLAKKSVYITGVSPRRVKYVG